MLVFITPKLNNKRIPYSYRARATIPSANVKGSRVTDDISSLKPDDIAVLGKKHTKEDAEYCISKEINYIVDIADDKFDMFKHWRFTIPNANAVTTTCHRLREVIHEETGSKSYVIPDPTERPRGEPKFEVKDSGSIEGGLNAPMPGKVVEVQIKKGSSVKKGDTLIILEAMKMEHKVSAPSSGKIKNVLVSNGDQVENGQTLVVLD